MTAHYTKGEKVYWKWGKGMAEGVITEVHKKPISKQIKGALVKRNGSDEDPAYFITQDNDQHVLKLGSELLKK